MPSDSESRRPAPQSPDLWALPDIESLKIEQVRYRQARKHLVAGEVVEFVEGVEIIVRTQGEIPIRALSPVLHVGAAERAENEQIKAMTYRFFVLDEKALQAGAPITLGWVGPSGAEGQDPLSVRAARERCDSGAVKGLGHKADRTDPRGPCCSGRRRTARTWAYRI